MHNACASMGPSAPMHCGDASSAQHCDAHRNASVAPCDVQYARPEAPTAQGPSIDPLVDSGTSDVERTPEPVFTSSVIHPLIRRAVSHAHRRHVRVGVWLE
ncbi:MAG: hypothetical protein ACLFTE_07765 [Salinivenus sp.]